MNIFSKIVAYEDTQLKRMRKLKGSARQTKKLLALEYGTRFPRRVTDPDFCLVSAVRPGFETLSIRFHYDDDEVVMSCRVRPVQPVSHLTIPIPAQGASS